MAASAPEFKVVFTDKTEQVVRMLPKAQIAYERKTKRSLKDDIANITEMYEMVWYAMGNEGTFDDFIEDLEYVEAVGDDEDEVGEPPLDTGE